MCSSNNMNSTWTAYSPSSCSNSTSGNMAAVLFMVFCQLYCLWPSHIYYIDKMCMQSWCHHPVKPSLDIMSMALPEKNHIIYESVPVRISALRHAKIGCLLVLGPPTPGVQVCSELNLKKTLIHIVCYVTGGAQSIKQTKVNIYKAATTPNALKTDTQSTRSQAVARIADRTAKNCRGHVT